MQAEIRIRLLHIREELVDTCDVCKGSGYLDEIYPGVANPCECMQIFNFVMDLVETGIANSYWNLALDELVMAPEYIKLVKLVITNIHRFRKQGLGLLFLGTNGVGKTSLMTEIGKEALVQGYKVKYLSAQSYVDMTKTGDTKDVNSELLLNDFILLDELDKVYIKKGSDYAPKTLEVFLRAAMINAGVSVICATNLAEDTFTKTFGESTISMMKRKMNFVAIDGDDYSNTLNEQWGHLLMADYDYYHKNLVIQAKRKQTIITEKELHEWEE